MLVAFAQAATAFAATSSFALPSARAALRTTAGVSMIGSLFGLMPEPSMVKPEFALPGRAQKMQVAPNHYIFRGNTMEGPWPEGHKVAVFANGCFVRARAPNLT